MHSCMGTRYCTTHSVQCTVHSAQCTVHNSSTAQQHNSTLLYNTARIVWRTQHAACGSAQMLGWQQQHRSHCLQLRQDTLQLVVGACSWSSAGVSSCWLRCWHTLLQLLLLLSLLLLLLPLLLLPLLLLSLLLLSLLLLSLLLLL